MIRKTYKTYFRCSTQDEVITGVFGDEMKIITNALTFNGMRNSNGTYSAVPAWFTQYNGFPALDTFWAMTPPAVSTGSYEFSWTAENKDATYTEYIVRLTMLDYCDIPIGCATGTTSKPMSLLLWLNREGGWSYFPFNGKKSFEVKIPDADTYLNADYQQLQVSRNGVANGETLSTGDIPELALELLQSLKESIQVYYIENPTEALNAIYHPIILMDGDFIKRKTDERMWDVKVKFLYSQQRVIQSA